VPRVATKYPRMAAEHFASRGIQAEIIYVQLFERPAQTRRLRPFVLRELVGSPPAHAVHLLRGVDQKEEQREGSRYGCRELERQSVDLFQHVGERRCRDAAAAPVPRQLAQLLHGAKCLFTLESSDYLAEHTGEVPHVFVESFVFGTNFDAAHNGLFLTAMRRKEVSGARSLGFFPAGIFAIRESVEPLPGSKEQSSRG
jgi:hypothetical protein